MRRSISKQVTLSDVFRREEYFSGFRKGFIIFYYSIEVGMRLSSEALGLLLREAILLSKKELAELTPKACVNSRSSRLGLLSGKIRVSLGKNLSFWSVVQ